MSSGLAVPRRRSSALPIERSVLRNGLRIVTTRMPSARSVAVGLFVGVAAFFGAFMNWNFIMAGSASTNGFLAVVAIFLVLAWKVAGYYGLDYYLLPRLGTPWQPLILEKKKIGRPTVSAQGAD